MLEIFPPKSDSSLHPRAQNRGGRGTYVSEFEYFKGLEFEEDPYSCIVEKKSRYGLTEQNWDKVDFLEFLMANPHPNLLVPNNIIAIMGKPLIEYYDYYFDPTLADIEFDIRRAMREGSITMEHLIETFAQIADGLSHMHDNGFLHRDIAGRNVLLVREGGGFTAKLFDYGVATRPFHMDEPLHRWNPHPPEEDFGDIWIDTRQDVWELGNLFREVTMGSHPIIPNEFMRIVKTATGPLESRQQDAGVVRDQLLELL